MLYPYDCDTCGYHQDVDQPMWAPHPETLGCPLCHEGTMRRVYGPVAVTFKGPGFYSTDHPREESKT